MAGNTTPNPDQSISFALGVQRCILFVFGQVIFCFHFTFLAYVLVYHPIKLAGIPWPEAPVTSHGSDRIKRSMIRTCLLSHLYWMQLPHIPPQLFVGEGRRWRKGGKRKEVREDKLQFVVTFWRHRESSARLAVYSFITFFTDFAFPILAYHFCKYRPFLQTACVFLCPYLACQLPISSPSLEIFL